MTLSTTTSAALWRGAELLAPLAGTASLEVYDLRTTSPEVRLSISSLTGLLNRYSAKIYCLENNDDDFWLRQLATDVPCTRSPLSGEAALEHLLRTHREQVAGLVMYDPDLLDTRNVATTLAGVRSGLVVAPEQAKKLQGAPYHLPVLADLRAYGWRNRLQAYTWAAEHVLPECSPDLLAGLDPRLCGGLRSLLVTRSVFTCWLDTRQRLPAPAAIWPGERALFKRILAHFHPGALHLGWFIDEPSGIRLTSQAALLTLASDHCTNLAVWSTLHALPPTPPASEGEGADMMATPPEVAREPLDRRTTYLSFTISDGDNLQYCQHHLLHLWNNPARGSLPLGWTIAPALWQIMPRLADFYRRTASAQDELIAGPSGAAYMLPSHWPSEHQEAFLQLTGRTLQTMSPALLQVLDSRSWLSRFSMRFLNPTLQTRFAAQLAPHGLRGILSGAGGFFPSWKLRAGLPIYQNLGLALNAQRALSLIRSAMRRGVRFINIYIFAWNISPADLQRVVEQLDGNVRVVTPMRLLELIQEAERP
ncbi:MAG TPA: GxGYxYP domain-containing protein [Ktedonobacteraceae bacterium]|nr:GxGYxYP domain-containing protein [Ktedonobacteraceae bacterium]